MKKCLFGLVATVTLAFAGNAQESAALKTIVDAQMVTLIQTMKPSYKAGMTLSEWIKETGPYDPTSMELELLAKTYSYVSGRTTSCEIFNVDNSILLKVSKQPISDAPPSNEARICGWKCIMAIIRLSMEPYWGEW
ncbi:MAG TPA: hypothetical protein VF581_02390 [Flavobacterium sp.]|jgi:hypothetical protein